MPFEILGEISDLETIATGNKIREIKRLRRIYGRGRWRKRKGVPRGEGIRRNRRINPLQSKLPMHLSCRCGARTRSGSPCQSPAMPNGLDHVPIRGGL